MATHSSILAWRTPWTEEPGRLQSMGSKSRTGLSDFTFTFKGLQKYKGERGQNWNTFTGEITHELNIKGQESVNLEGKQERDHIMYKTSIIWEVTEAGKEMTFKE